MNERAGQCRDPDRANPYRVTESQKSQNSAQLPVPSSFNYSHFSSPEFKCLDQNSKLSSLCLMSFCLYMYACSATSIDHGLADTARRLHECRRFAIHMDNSRSNSPVRRLPVLILPPSLSSSPSVFLIYLNIFYSNAIANTILVHYVRRTFFVSPSPSLHRS